MIQDIAPHRLDNHFRPGEQPRDDSMVLIFGEKHRNELLVRKDSENLECPEVRELREAGICTDVVGAGQKPDTEGLIYLLTLDGKDMFLGRIRDDSGLPGYVYRNMRDLRKGSAQKRQRIFAALTGYQLSNWYRDNRFCGTCGTETVLSERERAIVCPHCKRTIYPRIIPAVIVGVIDKGSAADGSEDRLLMTKYNGRSIPFYALIAGFTEIGETLEQTVHREVMEEVGLKVKNLRYYKSQPWGIVDDLLSGFYCEADGSTDIRLDHSELKVGVWMKRDEVVLQPDDFSLTNEMMTVFKEGREERELALSIDERGAGL